MLVGNAPFHTRVNTACVEGNVPQVCLPLGSALKQVLDVCQTCQALLELSVL